MSEQDFADMIRLARRAPLTNMDEAEAVAGLLQRFAAFVDSQLRPPVVDSGQEQGEGE